MYDFSEEAADTTAFVDKIANDYLGYLAGKQVAVPGKWREYVLDELRDQIRKMMLKKMYGCLSIEEFQTQNSALKNKRKTVRKKYKKLF